jgi:hypothetical protein
VSYGYDGEGMRVKKVEGGMTVWYVQSTLLKQAPMEVINKALMDNSTILLGAHGSSGDGARVDYSSQFTFSASRRSNL